MIVALALLAVLFPAATLAEVSARLDQSTISLTDSVTLLFESERQPAVTPDLSALASEFEILDRRISSKVSIVNGERTARHTLALRLRPLRAGTIRIPSISFDDSQTAPLQLTVTAPLGDTAAPAERKPLSAVSDRAAQSAAPLLEAQLQPKKGYVGQQFILSAKVFTEGPIDATYLPDPRVANSDVLPLGEERYQTEREGTRYQVYERRYALFPRRAGVLQVDPMELKGWTEPQSKQLSQVLSSELSAEVLPVPNGPGEAARLAARSIALSEAGPQTYRTRAGEPIARRINLRADGIMSRNLPALPLQTPHELATQLGRPRLWDERRPDGVVGYRQELMFVRPREPGSYQLPPISLDWWNTATRQWETAVLPARELMVAAAPSQERPFAPGASVLDSQGEKPLPTVESESASGETTADRSAQAGAPSKPRSWLLAIVALVAALAAALIGWRRIRRTETPTLPSPPATTTQSESSSSAADPLPGKIAAVRVAYESGDAEGARSALLDWARVALPEQPPTNLARLAQRSPQPLRAQILLLERAFFSPTVVSWDKEPVWDWLEGFEPVPVEEPASFRRPQPIRRRSSSLNSRN